jgi:DNA-binding GntR family transcriptional regulator
MGAMLQYAHRQHHAIVEAIALGQGARAEALMREHAFAAKESINMVAIAFAADPAQPGRSRPR